MHRFYKQSLNDDDTVQCVADAGYWPTQAPDLYTGPLQSRTLLQELYDEPTHDLWSQQLHSQQQQQQYHQLSRSHEYQITRRNTFPVVRCDRDAQFQPFISPQYQDQFSADSPLVYHDTSTIKLEDPSSILVPSHQPFYRSQSSAAAPLPMPYTSPHPSLHVQHTDDAASKETQYLRRRCFNCHTTEPPSWRRSTLNPGKIVCNKCGLYERTHLRPRPLRFDELRAGNKHRRTSKDTTSSKAKPSVNVRKGPSLLRRASVSSNGSVHSASTTSDWDENVSVYSSGPPTSFNSPDVQSFPLSRDSQSPPHDGTIRLPNAPLSDIASLTQQLPHSSQPSTPSLPPTPPNMTSSPAYFSPPSMPTTPNAANLQAQEYFCRSHDLGVSGLWSDASLKDPPTTILSSPVPMPVAS